MKKTRKADRVEAGLLCGVGVFTMSAGVWFASLGPDAMDIAPSLGWLMIVGGAVFVTFGAGILVSGIYEAGLVGRRAMGLALVFLMALPMIFLMLSFGGYLLTRGDPFGWASIAIGVSGLAGLAWVEAGRRRSLTPRDETGGSPR